jgi:hypothetical protein
LGHVDYLGQSQRRRRHPGCGRKHRPIHPTAERTREAY